MRGQHKSSQEAAPVKASPLPNASSFSARFVLLVAVVSALLTASASFYAFNTPHPVSAESSCPVVVPPTPPVSRTCPTAAPMSFKTPRDVAARIAALEKRLAQCKKTARHNLQHSQRKFRLSDLPSQFGVNITHSVLVSPSAAASLASGTLSSNSVPLGSLDVFQPYIEQTEAGYRPEEVAALTYIQHVDFGVGYGLFADKALPVDTVIGEYTGELVDLDYWEYAWAYPVEVKKQTLSLVVDATKHGNQLRFVNDGGSTSNCRVVYTIFNRSWHIFYQTTRPIAADEELRVHYSQLSFGRIDLAGTLDEVRYRDRKKNQQRQRLDFEQDDDEEEPTVGGRQKKSKLKAKVSRISRAKQHWIFEHRVMKGVARLLNTTAADPIVDIQRDLKASDILEADIAVGLMLQRGQDNQTYVDTVNRERGRFSPFMRFQATQLRDVFGIDLIRRNLISTIAEPYLKTHTVDVSQESARWTTEPWVHFLKDEPEVGYREEDLEKLYYIRWSNSFRGFGIFAARNLENGTVLGQYTGVMLQKGKDSDYAWEMRYIANEPSAEHDVPKLRLKQTMQLDSRSIGNAMRFVNDERVKMRNCESFYVSKNNLWHIFYRTAAPVRQDEELFISYGEGYWSSRV